MPNNVLTIPQGNHDLTLDPFHSKTTRENHFKAKNLFTSIEAQSNGIHYLDTEVRYITLRGGHKEGSKRPITIPIYGNPHQPQWLATDYSFTYKPYPSPESELPWENAPNRTQNVPIWVMHGGPQGRLDQINIPPLQGCVVEAQKIYEARPLLCVYGHFHVAYGVEHVEYEHDKDVVKTATVITKPEDPRYDFSKKSGKALKPGKETIFANVAWMTGLKRQVPERNKPVVIDLELPYDH